MWPSWWSQNSVFQLWIKHFNGRVVFRSKAERLRILTNYKIERSKNMLTGYAHNRSQGNFNLGSPQISCTVPLSIPVKRIPRRRKLMLHVLVHISRTFELVHVSTLVYTSLLSAPYAIYFERIESSSYVNPTDSFGNLFNRNDHSKSIKPVLHCKYGQHDHYRTTVMARKLYSICKGWTRC